MIKVCDYHPGVQQIAIGTRRRAMVERRLGHREQAEQFYRDLQRRG